LKHIVIIKTEKKKLTVVTFALHINGPLKKISATYNGIVVGAIHDDIVLSGSPKDIFGRDGGKGVLWSVMYYLHSRKGKYSSAG
jgi:hypothetical protein